MPTVKINEGDPLRGASEIDTVQAALPENRMLCLLETQRVIINRAHLGLNLNLVISGN